MFTNNQYCSLCLAVDTSDAFVDTVYVFTGPVQWVRIIKP
jgi:hypothetical protein